MPGGSQATLKELDYFKFSQGLSATEWYPPLKESEQITQQFISPNRRLLARPRTRAKGDPPIHLPPVSP